MESTPIHLNDIKPTHSRFAVEKCKSHETRTPENGSNQNLLLSEDVFEEDDVFEPGGSRLKFQLSTDSTNSRSRQSSAQYHRQKRQTKLKILVAVLALIIITVVVLVWHFYHLQTVVYVSVGGHIVAKVDAKEKTMTVVNNLGISVVKVTFDSNSDASGSLEDLKHCSSPTDNLCLRWSSTNASLSVDAARFRGCYDDNITYCVKVAWITNGPLVPNDCVHLKSKDSDGSKSSTVWFGSHDYIFLGNNGTTEQTCVSSTKQCVPFVPGYYIPKDNYKDLLQYRGGDVVEATWFSSEGVALKASNHHTVRVCTDVCNHNNDPQLCMEPLLDHSHQEKHHDGKGYHLDYMICVADTLPIVYRDATEYFVKPSEQCKNQVHEPFIDVLNDGAYFESDLEQNILNFSRDAVKSDSLLSSCSKLFEKPLWSVILNGGTLNDVILHRQLSQLAEVGGTCSLPDTTQVYRTLGDFDLRYDEQISTQDIFTVLKNLELSVMLPITPFINFDSVNFGYAAQNGFLISNKDRSAPLLTAISSKLFPGIIDLTNTNASQWFVDRILQFSSNNSIEYLHFFYGQPVWLPHSEYSLTKPLHNIGHFSTLYTDVASRANRCSVTDVAYGSQLRNQLVLLSPSRNIRETLSSVLSAGLAGYPFFVANFPETIKETTNLMERGPLLEMLIRWTEMAAFFPIMHLPWDYQTLEEQHADTSTFVDIARKYLAVRNGPDVWPKLKEAINIAELNSSRPVVAPMWMAPGSLLHADNRERVLLIEDQFMVGSDMFVAPILDLDKEHRTIYIPPGEWKDVVNHNDVETKTGKWMKNYRALLDEIPAFVRTTGRLE